jgi:serine/threonine-protein kinase RsbW
MIQGGIIHHIKLSSKIESLALLESFVNDFCEQNTIDEDNYGNILIALTEAVNNAITHGNHLNPKKIVSLNAEGNDKTVEFEVKDEGDGFDFNNIPDPTLPENIEKSRGRGVFLMKNLADNVAFENNGSVIRLKFSISAS